ncbi:MAG: hypothetical protein HY287_15020 [Planctomycetes bacterium]|nr:hypothetical protein [Planctomycetota bacterium]MBI3835636.1 hypothetical protein [Planctomycetota bacterium]
MPTIIQDAQQSAKKIAAALTGSGYRADFSLTSLKEIDRFFDESVNDGKALPGGLLHDQVGAKLFALGAYVGETIRTLAGGHWKVDESDPQNPVSLQLVLNDGSMIWPVERVMKRFQNGAEDGIYAYGVAMLPKKQIRS